MCWLYSMTNLLVIQHLEILYLGGNHVRVVCERVWRNAQDSVVKQKLAAGTRGLQATKSCTCAEHAGELNSHVTWSTIGQKSRLAIKLARGLNSWLSQVARSSRQPALFWKNWLLTFHSHTSINTPHSHKICVSIQNEKP